MYVVSMIRAECGWVSDSPSITKGVVQHGLGLELQGVWCTDDVDDGDMLGEG